MYSAYYWDRGLKSAQNQDSLFLLEVRTRKGKMTFAAVCDGIGGLKSGEMASGYVTERLMEEVYERLIPYLEKGDWKKASNAVLRTLYDAKEKMSDLAKRKEISLGTTVLFVCMMGSRYLALHCGDSRLYRMGIFGARNVFTDDVEQGKLNSCIGSVKGKKPDIHRGMLLKGEGLLLCSDGFYTKLSADTLDETLRCARCEDKMLEKRLKTLGEEARRLGSADDISAIAIFRR